MTGERRVLLSEGLCGLTCLCSWPADLPYARCLCLQTVLPSPATVENMQFKNKKNKNKTIQTEFHQEATPKISD